MAARWTVAVAGATGVEQPRAAFAGGGGSPALRLPVCRVGGRVSRTGGALEAGRAGQVVHDDDATHAVGAPSGRVKAGEGEAAAVQYGGDVLVEAALGLVAAEAALPVLLVSVPARSPH